MPGIGDEFGRGLSKRKGSFLMPCFLLHNPHIMLLTEWTPQSDDIFKPGPPNKDVAIKKVFTLMLKKPCPFVQHWDVARRLLASGPDTETSWPLQKLVLSQRPGSFRAVLVHRALPRTALTLDKVAKRTAADAALDPIDAAIRDVTHPKRPPVRRHRKKGKPIDAGGASSNTSDAVEAEFGSDGSISEGIVVDEGSAMPAEPQAARQQAPRRSFFHREEDLGILRYEYDYKRSAKCHICSLPVQVSDCARAVYAYSMKKPWAYVHMPCVASLEAQFLPPALRLLRASPPGPDVCNYRATIARGAGTVLASALEAKLGSSSS